MPTVERFEELRVWQNARGVVREVYRMTDEDAFRQDSGLRDQIRRAAVSVMSNIAEGFHAGSDAEFVRFLGYARRSLAEVQSQLYIGLDQRYLTEEAFAAVYAQSEAVFRQINALIGYLKSSREGKSFREALALYQTPQPNHPAETNLTNQTNQTTKTNPTASSSLQPNSRHCFVCGLENPFGLGLRFFQTDEDEVTATYIVPERYQGYPGVVHGGIVAAMLDEASGRALMGTDPETARFMYTARLEVKYRQNVPVGEPLRLVGKVVKNKRRTAVAQAFIYDQNEKVLAEAEALLVEVPAEVLQSIDVDALGWKVYPL